MLTRRISTWAETRPDSLAVVANNVELSYRRFMNSISQFQRLFIAANLKPPGITIIVSTKRLEPWLMMLAARSLGIDTIYVHSLTELAELRLKNIICIVLESGSDSAADQHYHRTVGD